MVSENILTTNYSDTHHREITVNTREDATETIPWFNTNLIFLQCSNIHPIHPLMNNVQMDNFEGRAESDNIHYCSGMSIHTHS